MYINLHFTYMYIESRVTRVCKYVQGGSVTVAMLIPYNEI